MRSSAVVNATNLTYSNGSVFCSHRQKGMMITDSKEFSSFVEACIDEVKKRFGDTSKANRVVSCLLT